MKHTLSRTDLSIQSGEVHQNKCLMFVFISLARIDCEIEPFENMLTKRWFINVSDMGNKNYFLSRFQQNKHMNVPYKEAKVSKAFDIQR